MAGSIYKRREDTSDQGQDRYRLGRFEEEMNVKIVFKEPQKQKCLKCGRGFLSVNRVCYICKASDLFTEDGGSYNR